MTENTPPNFETVARAVVDVTSPGISREIEGNISIAARGLTFVTKILTAKVALFIVTWRERDAICLQPLVIQMKGLLFVGGFKNDKSIFAVVSDDRPNSRFVHVFRSADHV